MILYIRERKKEKQQQQHSNTQIQNIKSHQAHSFAIAAESSKKSVNPCFLFILLFRVSFLLYELNSRSRLYVQPQIKNVWQCSCHVCGVKNSLRTLFRIMFYFFNQAKFGEYNGRRNEVIFAIARWAHHWMLICWLYNIWVCMHVCAKQQQMC